MHVHCQDCDSSFLLSPDGMTQAAACPHCGGARLERDQPNPTHSDGDIRNMPNEGTDPALGLDQGGNPNQEGIWAQTDGGWQPFRRRDESFASVKEAAGYKLPGEEFVPDPEDPAQAASESVNRMKLRHQLKQNGIGIGHQLGWTPGQHGRGLFVGPYLHSWNAYDPNTVHQSETPDMGTMHGEYINQLGVDPNLVDPSTGVEIQPDGTVEPLSGRDPSEYARVDPRLRAGERQWSFGSMSRAARSLNMDPYMPWTHLADAVLDQQVIPRHVATVVPGPHGIHNGTLKWLSFLDAHVNGKSARENHNELFQRHGMRNSPEFGQPVEVAVHDPAHLPAAIETIETSADAQSPPQLKDLALQIHHGQIAPPPGINPAELRFSKIAGPLALLGLPALGEGLAGALMGRAVTGVGMHAVMNGAKDLMGGGGQPQPQGPASVEPRTNEQLSHVTADYETPHTNPRLVDSEDGDTHEFDDESGSAKPHNPNIPGAAGGAAQGEDEVGAGYGSDKPSFSPGSVETFNLLLPKILDYAHSDKSALEDPQLKALHEQLEKENPGYVDKGDDEAVEAYLNKLREPSAVEASTKFTFDLPGAPVQSVPPNAQAVPGNDFANNQGRCNYCGGQTGVTGRCAQCGATNNPDHQNSQPHGLGPGFNPQTVPGAIPQPQYPIQAAALGHCEHCGAVTDAQGNCPQCGAQVPSIEHPGVEAPNIDKTASDHQGPSTDEQKKAVAELLIDEGRHEEIPHMLEAPWDYSKEMAAIAQRPNVVPNVDPNEQAPPQPAQEIAPPGATMPVPNPADPSGGQMVSHTASEYQDLMNKMGYDFDPNEFAAGIKEELEHKDITGGDLETTAQIAAAHLKEDPKYYTKLKKAMGRSVYIAADDPNVVGVPAADQVGQHDVSQEQDSSHTWKVEDGTPLQVGQGYEIHSPEYAIPDIVKIVAIKPDSITVETTGEFTADPDKSGLNYQYEITRQELQMDGLTFTPSSGQEQEHTPEEQQEDPNGPLEPANTEQQEVPHVQQPLSSVQEDPDPEEHCPRCANTRFSSEMSSPTTTFHECDKCAHVWETKEQDYIDHNTASREWINESGSGEDEFFDTYEKIKESQQSRDLSTVAKRTAGKNFTPREQREFIEEQGVARNADKLDLEDTHYARHRDLGYKVDGMNVPDSHLFMGW